jgi:hypothetical protein
VPSSKKGTMLFPMRIVASVPELKTPKMWFKLGWTNASQMFLLPCSAMYCGASDKACVIVVIGKDACRLALFA